MKKFTNKLLLLTNKDQVIIGNKLKCTYLKISMECYEVLLSLLSNNAEERELAEYFEEKEDALYFNDLYKALSKKEILIDAESEEKNGGVSVQLEITNQCNLRCKHCIAEAVPNDEVPSAHSEDKLYEMVEKIIKLNPISFTITGGEPMVLPCFFDLSMHIRKRYKNKMVLMTNGTLITDENARIIAEIYDEVDISIDGIDEDSCRKIRGAGVFSKVISAIRHLKDSKLENISLSMVLTNENKQYEEKFEQLCRTLKVRPLIRSFAAEGRGKEHKDWYINSVVCEDDDDVDFEFLERRKKGQPQIELSTCEGLYGSFSIKPNGDVYLCAPMDAHLSPVCNLFDIEDVTVFFNSEIYKQTSAFKDFNEAMPDSVDRCKSCNVRYFCWSCPFIFKQATMNDKFFEQWCEFNKKDLSAAIWGE